jgi:hypothetical protein
MVGEELGSNEDELRGRSSFMDEVWVYGTTSQARSSLQVQSLESGLPGHSRKNESNYKFLHGPERAVAAAAHQRPYLTVTLPLPY